MKQIIKTICAASLICAAIFTFSACTGDGGGSTGTSAGSTSGMSTSGSSMSDTSSSGSEVTTSAVQNTQSASDADSSGEALADGIDDATELY